MSQMPNIVDQRHMAARAVAAAGGDRSDR